MTASSPDCTHSAAECAVRLDGASPAREFVEGMQEGAWEDDPYFKAPPDNDQIYDMAKLVAELEHLVEWGCPSRRTAVNHLEVGVWELKFGVHRLAYFDTPGDGTYEPKLPVEDAASLPIQLQDDFWWYPSMDEVLRLTNGFSKTAQRAPQDQVSLALTIRDEDVQHDA